ncbi:MAG: carbonic anhydrase [Ostreibacterium sp.]
MKYFNKLALLVVLTNGLVLSGYVKAQDDADHDAHWGYIGAGNPENWGDLSPKYEMCSKGVNQSPINITGAIEGDLPVIKFVTVAKLPQNKMLENNGHTLQIEESGIDEIVLQGQHFALQQFHFHTPSENHIKGQSLPLEAHFVYADKAGNLAVIAVLFKEGKANKTLQQILALAPSKIGKVAFSQSLDKASLLPTSKDYYYFNGSLTTPPCTEGVRWLVMKAYKTVSAEQVAKFASIMHHNSRPLQPINARVIIQ